MVDELTSVRLIEKLFPPASPRVAVGIGDDTAALVTDPGKLLLATTDVQVESSHFILERSDPSRLARKAVAVSLSDIGAMGGVPRYFLASLGLPPRCGEDFFQALLEGFSLAAAEFGIELIGGNISASETVFIDTTVLGEVEPEVVVRRSGAAPGEGVYVSGTLGDAALGLMLLGEGRGDRTHERWLARRYESPEPRVALGRALALAGVATSMIDISDGLLLDLERLMEKSALGAEVELGSVPLSGAFSEVAPGVVGEGLELAVTGGEDYELLFTARGGEEQRIREVSLAAGVEITRIATTVAGGGVRVLDASGAPREFKRKGFVHLSV